MPFLSFVPWKLVAVAAFFIGVLAWGWNLGNAHGSHARAYRAMVAEINKKNAELAVFKRRDEEELAEAEKVREAAHAEAKTLVSCPASKAVVEALNRIGE